MKRPLFIIFLSSLLLIGCNQNSEGQSSGGGIKNKAGIYSPSVRDCSTIEVKATTVEYMINSKYSFHLLMYTEDCSYCEKANENTEEIIKWTGFAIYKIEMFEGSISYLANAFGEYFSANDSYPALLTFKDGELTFKANTNDITDLASYKRYINANTYKVNINTVITKDGYNSFNQGSLKYLLYTYSSSEQNAKDIYFEHIFPHAYKAFDATIIIDISLSNSDLIAQIREDFNLSENETIDLLSTHNVDNTKTTLRYSQESDSNIDNLLTSFFNSNSI